jgi:hypothetical protein
LIPYGAELFGVDTPLATGTADTGTTRATSTLNLGMQSLCHSFEAPQTESLGAKSLPELDGSGAVADLQVAAQSGALASLLFIYASRCGRPAAP